MTAVTVCGDTCHTRAWNRPRMNTDWTDPHGSGVQNNPSGYPRSGSRRIRVHPCPIPVFLGREPQNRLADLALRRL